MKIICWLPAKLIAVAGAVLVCGCVAPGAPPVQGLSAQPLVNVAQPAAKSSWLSKLPFQSPAQGKSNAESVRTATMQDSQPLEPAPAKGDKKKIDLVALGRLNERRGQTDMAKQLYQRELELHPQNGLVHHRLAVMAAKEEDWNKANEHFQIAQRLMPDNADLLSDLGYALYLQHRLDAAEAALRTAVAASPRNQSAHNNLGIVLGVQGKYEESFAEFKHAGTTAQAHANLAYTQAQLGDIDLAMGNLNRALSLDSNLKAATIELIQLNDLKKRFDVAPQAENALVKHEQVSPQSSDASALATVLDRQTMKGAQGDRLAAREVAPADLREEAAELPRVVKQVSADEQQPLAQKGAVDASDLIDRVVEVAPRQSVAKPALYIDESQARVAAASSPVAQPPMPIAVVARPAEMPSPSATAADATPPAHTPPDAAAPRPQAQVLPASASNSSSRRRVQKPITDDASAMAVTPTGPAPVISPSQRMQQIRTTERQEADAKFKDQIKPSIKLAPVAKPIEPTAAVAPSGTPAFGDGHRANYSPAGITGASFPQIFAPGDDRAANHTELPTRMPSIPIPRPEDLMPADALLQQAPTSQLHPSAQSTWSSSSQPLRYLTDQKGLDAAHFFKAPAAPADAAGAAPQQSLPTGLGAQVADQSQYEALKLPMKY